jgi:hypothetical protein
MQCWLRPPLTQRDSFDDALPGRSNNMTPRMPEEFSTSPFVITGNTMPPRDPNEDEEDDDEEEEEEERADEPPAVREPDED